MEPLSMFRHHTDPSAIKESVSVRAVRSILLETRISLISCVL